MVYTHIDTCIYRCLCINIYTCTTATQVEPGELHRDWRDLAMLSERNRGRQAALPGSGLLSSIEATQSIQKACMMAYTVGYSETRWIMDYTLDCRRSLVICYIVVRSPI